MTASAPRQRTAPRSIPRWAAFALAPLVWLVAIPLVHGVVPWAVSWLGPRYGWHDGIPSYWNLIGLIPVLAGAIVLLWLMVVGFVHAAKMLERVELNWRPNILLTSGPYRFCRHPMYVGELALWIGWATLFGSPVVLVCLIAFLIVVGRLAPKEERDLEAAFGEQYREYMNAVPRWLSVGWRVGRSRGDRRSTGDRHRRS